MDLVTIFSPINIASFSFGAILVCVTCLVYMILHRRYEKVQSRLLLVVIIVLIVNAASSMTAEVLKAHMQAGDAAAISVYVANYLYFVSHTALAPLICVYFLVVCGKSSKRTRLGYTLPAIPFFATELLAITNPLTHWVYYYGPDMAFTRNWAMYVLYIVAAYYLLYGVYALFSGWRALTPVKRRAIVYFFIMVCFGVVIQLLVPGIRLELFAESIGVMGIVLFVESEGEFIDSETGVYNRNALKANIDSFVNSRTPVYAINVRVTNADAFTRIAGSAQARQYMVSVVASHIKKIVPWYRVYRTAPAQYAVFDSTIDEQGAREIADKIFERFEDSWDYRGAEIHLTAVVAIARVPDDLKTSDDIFYFIDSTIPTSIERKVLEWSDLGFLMRQAEVERAVQRGLTESNYEMYYQPIIAADGTVHAAEALVRLHDSMLGDLQPTEFIEVVERIGFIEGVSEFALREVCAFIREGVLQDLGLEHIGVNLSVIQCMRADLPERIKGTIEEYGVEPHQISFEITESVAAANYEFLDRTMSQIRKDGHHFSMDDYGTGYSNLHSLLTLDFDVVKIDKNVLWDAEKSAVGMAILENSAGLLHNIGCKVLVEGVETESQLKLLQNLSVDYYQGFYFSRPLPKDEFIAYVEKHRV